MSQPLVLILVAVVGLCIGSFACVVIDRLPLALDEPNEFGELWDTRPWAEVLGGRSRCSSCGTPVRAVENVPVLAWLALRGRCRTCGSRIPAFHVVVELAIPAFAVWAVAVRGWTWTTTPVLLLVVVGVIIAVIDLRVLMVPTRLVWPAFAVAAALSVAIAMGLGEPIRLFSGLIGLLVLAGPLFLIWWIHPRGMGFGDVRLSVLVGWIVGFDAGTGGWTVAAYAVLIVFILAALIGIAIGLVSAVAQVRGIKQVPFGPALVLAGYLVILAMPNIREALGR